MSRSLRLMAMMLCFFGCFASKAQANTTDNLPGDAQRVWDEYKDNLLAIHAFQDGCEPTHKRPATGSEEKGVIILLHGFTSCPKQFFQMADHLSAQGFHVLLPTLPGHGRAGTDELQVQEQLPGSKNWFIYGSFAHWINRLARSVGTGDVHIGGLCLGATIATQALQLGPELFSQGLLLSPYFEVSKPLLGRVGRWVGRAGDILDIETQLQHPIALQDNNVCENIERKIHGRAGYCKVRLTNLIAVSRYAFWIQKQWRGFDHRVQTLLVEQDDVAHPQTTLRMLGNDLNAHSQPDELTCFLNAAVTHSLFSPTDLPLPKPWLPALHTDIAKFFVTGTPVTQSHPSAYRWTNTEAAVKSCALYPTHGRGDVTVSESGE